jgi:carboxymethylenebutenolidase
LLLVASRTKSFDAVIDLWGGGVIATEQQLTPKRPVAVVDYTKDLSAPLLGIFGNDDQGPLAGSGQPARRGAAEVPQAV